MDYKVKTNADGRIIERLPIEWLKFTDEIKILLPLPPQRYRQTVRNAARNWSRRNNIRVFVNQISDNMMMVSLYGTDEVIARRRTWVHGIKVGEQRTITLPRAEYWLEMDKIHRAVYRQRRKGYDIQSYTTSDADNITVMARRIK